MLLSATIWSIKENLRFSYLQTMKELPCGFGKFSLFRNFPSFVSTRTACQFFMGFSKTPLVQVHVSNRVLWESHAYNYLCFIFASSFIWSWWKETRCILYREAFLCSTVPTKHTAVMYIFVMQSMPNSSVRSWWYENTKNKKVRHFLLQKVLGLKSELTVAMTKKLFVSYKKQAIIFLIIFQKERVQIILNLNVLFKNFYICCSICEYLQYVSKTGTTY